jgi:bifunctional DNA-binding transcriptional regulator/antitoxin component of YhaV-PrlF toxin-antitoxin module
MMVIGLTRLNNKGQIVIPTSMKDYFTKGEKLSLVKNNIGFILRKMNRTKELEDLEFAYETGKA